MTPTGACGCRASAKSSAAGDKAKAKSSGTLRISGGLLRSIGRRLLNKHFRPREAQIHQARLRNTFAPPLRDCLRRDGK